MLGHGALGDYLIAHGPPDAAAVTNARLSQLAAEVLAAGAGAARASQLAAEVLAAGAGNARLSQLALEVLREASPTVSAGVSQLALEILYLPGAEPVARLSQLAVELLRVWPSATGVGPGNGGEAFCVQLAANGSSVTATLTTALGLAATLLHLSGDSGLPSSSGFVLTIDSEQLYVTRQALGQYLILGRAMGGTQRAEHAAGAGAIWGDTYDMAIVSDADIAADFTWDTDDVTYPGWLLSFDCSQAYLGGDRFPLWVEELVGVFPPEGGDSKLDSSPSVAEHAPGAVTDDCPVGIGIPARIAEDISAGDIAVVRYVNPEGSTLTLCDRAVGLQTWYGFKRVDDADADTTFEDPPDPADHIVDGSIDGEFFGENFITATLPGDDREFTYGPPRFSEKGWPIAALAIRQGQRRVPHWTSPTWHDFTFVYTGFHTDAVFVHLLINRNGLIYGPLPSVTLPGPQDIDGPDATWDDNSYFSSTAWGVFIFGGAYVFLGPLLNDGGAATDPTIVPVVSQGSTGSPPTVGGPDESLIIEGGEGGDIDPPGGEVAEEFRAILV